VSPDQDDLELARAYQQLAEDFRDRWAEGRSREIAYVVRRAAGGDPRFSRMTERELHAAGRTRWSESGPARKLAALAEEYSALAKQHLEYAEFLRLRNRGA
jgi:hypothetical protein